MTSVKEGARLVRTKAGSTARKAGSAAKQAGLKARSTARKAGGVAKKAGSAAKRLFRINLANTLTLLNGVAGFLSIIFSIQEKFLVASLLILAGVLFDWLDGKAARAFGEVSPLGGELDSLSDLVTFGVAPAVMVATISPGFLSYVAGALFVISAALRLARFNVQHEKGVFVGVPTTANGYLLPLLVFLSAPLSWFPVYLFLMAFLMNAPIRIKKVF